MYILSLIANALLGAAIVSAMLGETAHHPLPVPILVPILVCAVHATVLIMYPIRRTKPLAMLLGVMACVSFLCLFLLEISGQPTYQIQSIKPVLSAPK